LFWKWYKLSHSSTLGYLIIKLHSFIQFSFEGVILLVSQPSCRFCMLTRVDLGWVFLTFFRLYCFLQFCPSIFCLLEIELWIFFILLSMELLRFYLIFSLLSDKILQHLISLKLIFYFNFILHWLRTGLHGFLPAFLSMKLSQSYAYDHRVSRSIWFDSSFFFYFLEKIIFFWSFTPRCWIVWLLNFMILLNFFSIRLS
jgi:hypothetical protein